MFNDRLRNLRMSKGITAKRAANDLGLPYTTYLGYERDEREPTADTLIRIAKYFDVSIDYLLGFYSPLRVEKGKEEIWN